MFKHRLPKRVPAGALSNATTPLLTIDAPEGEVTELFVKQRKIGGKSDEADAYFLKALHDLYGDRPFERGNLDAGRINRLFGRELKPVSGRFSSRALKAELFIDEAEAKTSFPSIFS